jgi:hypothetical protein
MKIINALMILILLLGLLACSVHKSNQSAGTVSQYGYLRLSGSMVNREAYIDGNVVGVDPEDDTNTFRLQSGMHKLEIRSKNRILLSSDILISDGQTENITVP